MFFFIIGLFALGIVVYPMIRWQINFTLANPNLLTPLVKSTVVLGAEPVENVNIKDKDFTDINNWFEGQESKITLGPQFSAVEFFKLRIPDLKIDADVEVGGTDLKKSLIAWPTSVAPGAYGSIFVFGHSALPAFYSPSRYNTIFTHIYDLPYGARIAIDHDSVTYTYEIEGKKIIQPTDLSILEQRYDAPRLILITCLPAGTYLTRGVITAKLVGG